MSQTRKIRWLIAHEPVDLFLRTAEAFQQNAFIWVGEIGIPELILMR